MAQPPRSRPLTIAHRAGNDLTRLSSAFDAGIDYVEADVWLHRGRLEVRHDKTAGLLPLLWDRWILKPGWTRRLLLQDVLAAARGKGTLFVDLKGREPGLAQAIADAVEEAEMSDAVAFSGAWAHLDKLSSLLPQAPLFYTVGTADRFAEIGARLEQREVRRISIDSRILTIEMVQRLREAGVESIAAWAVETADSVGRLLSWGVNGINSDSLALLAWLRDGRPEPPP